MYCPRPAIASAYWPSWAANLCGTCLKALRDEKEPMLVLIIENEEEAHGTRN